MLSFSTNIVILVSLNLVFQGQEVSKGLEGASCPVQMWSEEQSRGMGSKGT